MASLPCINHSWHVALYMTPTGLTMMSFPYKNLNFEIDFDFTKHQLRLSTSNADLLHFDLQRLSVADFYQKTKAMLKKLIIEIPIIKILCEIENPIPFEQDFVHATYDVEQVTALRRIFKGKCSPIHLF